MISLNAPYGAWRFLTGQKLVLRFPKIAKS